MNEPFNTIDLDRYPITDLEIDSSRALLAACQHQLRTSGLCLLPGFIREDALANMYAHVQSRMDHAHYTEHWRACPSGETPHASRTIAQATRASMHCIAHDTLGRDSPIRQIYEWPILTQFINAVYTGPQLYTTVDPIVSCMLSILEDGDELGWHYDPNDGVVSLLIQQPEQGGEFEFIHDIRAPKPDALFNEQQALDGHRLADKSIALAPGTLSLFNGFRSFHRVAPVCGTTPRVIALFNYAEVEHYQFRDDIRERFFGRVTSL